MSMFGTLRYDSQEDDTHFIPGARGIESGGPSPRYSACDSCRGKKQRCSGQRSGCERCRRTSNTCTYTQDTKVRGGRKDSRNSQNAGRAKSPSAPPPSPAPEKLRVTGHGQKDTDNRDISEETSYPSLQPIADTSLMDDTAASVDFDFMSDQILEDIIPGLDAGMASPLDTLAFHPLDGLSDNSSIHGEASLDAGTPLDCMAFSPNGISQILQDATSFERGIDSDYSCPILQDDFNTMLTTGSASRDRTSNSLETTQYPRSVGVQKDSSQSSQRTKSCRCCNIVASMLERFEARNSLVDRSALDKILASQREALNHCNSVLQCTECILRPEYILLLGVVAERLTTSCESIVAQYLSESSEQSRSNHSAFGRGKSKLAEEQNRIYIGSYEIESIEEWHGLMQFLIALQLRSLVHLLRRMKKAASTGVSATRLPNISATERRMAAMILQVRKSQA